MTRRRPRAILLAALTALALAGAPGAAGQEEAPPDARFARANDAYLEGRFEEAAEIYRALAAEGWSDARLEYNLGNAEFKVGRKGAAILHWQRALRLDPADRDARRNLEYARAFLEDRMETPPVPGWLDALRDRQNAIGPDRQAWAAVALLWLIALVLVASLARPGRWRPAWGWTLAGLALALALVSWSWWATRERVAGADLAVVLAGNVDLRSGPGASNPTIDRVHEGLTVEIRERREEWVQVSLPNGLSGWLPTAALGEV